MTREQQLVSQIQGLQGRLDNFKIDLGLTKDKLNRNREERDAVEAGTYGWLRVFVWVGGASVYVCM